MTEPRPVATVTADSLMCIGAGNCASVAPELFDLDPDEGTVILLHPEVSGRAVEVARAAADQCPSAAISVDPQP